MSKGFGKKKPSKQYTPQNTLQNTLHTPQNTPHLVVQTIISDGKPMEMLYSSGSDYEHCPFCSDQFKEIGKPCHWCLMTID